MSEDLPKSRIAAVLIGFPLVSTLISLLLLDRTSLSWTGMDFFTAFWLLVTAWYCTQIFFVSKILKSSGWSWSDIGYRLSGRKTLALVSGYLILSFALVGIVQVLLDGTELSPDKLAALSDLSDLTPKILGQRVVFVFMALAAGLSEELVYRGFAISSLRSHGLNKWLACAAAALPFVFQHGLKSLDQFWWFLTWGLVFGVLFVATKRLYVTIVLHWLVILSALLAVLQVVA